MHEILFHRPIDPLSRGRIARYSDRIASAINSVYGQEVVVPREVASTVLFATLSGHKVTEADYHNTFRFLHQSRQNRNLPIQTHIVPVTYVPSRSQQLESIVFARTVPQFIGDALLLRASRQRLHTKHKVVRQEPSISVIELAPGIQIDPLETDNFLDVTENIIDQFNPRPATLEPLTIDLSKPHAFLPHTA